mgnify:CR=1 FL=1
MQHRLNITDTNSQKIIYMLGESDFRQKVNELNSQIYTTGHTLTIQKGTKKTKRSLYENIETYKGNMSTSERRLDRVLLLLMYPILILLTLIALISEYIKGAQPPKKASHSVLKKSSSNNLLNMTKSTDKCRFYHQLKLKHYNLEKIRLINLIRAYENRKISYVKFQEQYSHQMDILNRYQPYVTEIENNKSIFWNEALDIKKIGILHKIQVLLLAMSLISMFSIFCLSIGFYFTEFSVAINNSPIDFVGLQLSFRFSLFFLSYILIIGRIDILNTWTSPKRSFSHRYPIGLLHQLFLVSCFLINFLIVVYQKFASTSGNMFMDLFDNVQDATEFYLGAVLSVILLVGILIILVVRILIWYKQKVLIEKSEYIEKEEKNKGIDSLSLSISQMKFWGGIFSYYLLFLVMEACNKGVGYIFTDLATMSVLRWFPILMALSFFIILSAKYTAYLFLESSIMLRIESLNKASSSKLLIMVLGFSFLLLYGLGIPLIIIGFLIESYEVGREEFDDEYISEQFYLLDKEATHASLEEVQEIGGQPSKHVLKNHNANNRKSTEFRKTNKDLDTENALYIDFNDIMDTLSVNLMYEGDYLDFTLNKKDQSDQGPSDRNVNRSADKKIFQSQVNSKVFIPTFFIYALFRSNFSKASGKTHEDDMNLIRLLNFMRNKDIFIASDALEWFTINTPERLKHRFFSKIRFHPVPRDFKNERLTQYLMTTFHGTVLLREFIKEMEIAVVHPVDIILVPDPDLLGFNQSLKSYFKGRNRLDYVVGGKRKRIEVQYFINTLEPVDYLAARKFRLKLKKETDK